MAFYVIQPKGDEFRWCKPEIVKINLTTKAGSTQLEGLRKSTRQVTSITYAQYTNRTYVIVEDEIVSAWTKSRLKVEILERAVQEKWSYEETLRALYEARPSERRRLLETAGVEEH